MGTRESTVGPAEAQARAAPLGREGPAPYSASMTDDGGFLYDQRVDTRRAADGLRALARSLDSTHRLRDDRPFGRPAEGLGYYAAVLELPGGQGLAIGTDGVGTKLMIAEAVGRYDGVPIDMIAMNVNDLVCVGAEPFALVDYVAIGRIDDDVFEQLGRGLLEGARRAGITIPGGETAQIGEMLRGNGPTEGFDLVGTAVGLVPWNEINLGADVEPGHVVIGLASSGLHSNGYSLARRVLLDDGGLALDAVPAGLARTLGEELLEPTRIYVGDALALRDAGLRPSALLHVTGDGFCNLNRVAADVGFVLDDLPEAPPLFTLIERLGAVSKAEMYSVFNMGIGFCVVVAPADADRAVALLEKRGAAPHVIGRAVREAGVRLPALGLAGTADRFVDTAS